MLTLTIPSMSCDGCVRSITAAITQLDATAQVDANLSRKQIQLTTRASAAEVRDALAAAGYPVE